MMSSENIPPVVQPPDHGHHNTTSTAASARKSAAQKLPATTPLKCPRCDSSNTKFCYYNNYNLTQPRHFCKTCRRYWTKGGALRNVPIGGGCRKTKKHKPPSSSCPNSSSSPFRLNLSAGPGTEADFKFLAPQTKTPAMEFQLGGLSLPRLHPATAGVYTQFIANSGAQPHHQSPLGVGLGTDGCFGFNLLGLGSNNNYPQTIPTSGNKSSSSSSSSLSLAGSNGNGNSNDQPLTISSIESLSSINQEMHWKLQQQRLAMIYGQPSVEDDNNNHNNINDQEKTLGGTSINLFKNLESARNNTSNKLELAAGPTPTEWLFEQIPANYGTNDNHNHNHNNNNNNNNNNIGVTTSCNNNNNHEGFNGVWTTDLHHQHQFNGLQ